MFCNLLRNARLGMGLTQRELAARVGISPSALGMYEQGRRIPGPKTAAALRAFCKNAGFPLPPPGALPATPPKKLLARGQGRR